MFQTKVVLQLFVIFVSPSNTQSFIPPSLLPTKASAQCQPLDQSNFRGAAPPGEEYEEEEEDLFSDEDEMLDFQIDSFLRGDYDRPFADDAPAPHPGLTPQTTIEAALQSLRKLDDPEPSHGAAVLLRFCVPLSRGERWGDSSSTREAGGRRRGERKRRGAGGDDEKGEETTNATSWKEILRGAITPTMLARRIRATEFSCLLDWERLDVTEGAFSVKRDDGIEIGLPSSIAFVNAALYFEDGVAPVLVQFTLRKLNGVWLIDSARISPQGLFVENDGGEEEFRTK